MMNSSQHRTEFPFSFCRSEKDDRDRVGVGSAECGGIQLFSVIYFREYEERKMVQT